MNRRFIFLATLGIVESINELCEDDIQRIDDPKMFREEWDLPFTPPLLENDDEAKDMFDSINFSKLNLNKEDYV